MLKVTMELMAFAMEKCMTNTIARSVTMQRIALVKQKKMKKKCSKCKKSKSITAFYPAPQCVQGVRPDCKSCNKSTRSSNNKKAKISNPQQRRSVVLKNKYGITAVEFDQMLMRQNYQCKVCGSTNPGPKGVFAVDHCHKTDKVRGLLCYLCNIGLGSFRDNTDFLASAIDYLKESNG